MNNSCQIYRRFILCEVETRFCGVKNNGQLFYFIFPLVMLVILNLRVVKHFQYQFSGHLGFHLPITATLISKLRMYVLSSFTAFDSTCVFNNFIVFSGNRDLRGGPVLVIDVSRPDWGNVAYTSVELTRLFMYFHTIPM